MKPLKRPPRPPPRTPQGRLRKPRETPKKGPPGPKRARKGVPEGGRERFRMRPGPASGIPGSGSGGLGSVFEALGFSVEVEVQGFSVEVRMVKQSGEL